MKVSDKKQGLTLVELLFSIALAALVIWVVGGGFQYATSIGAFSQNKQAAMNDAEKIMEEMRRVIDTNGLSGTGSATDTNYWSVWIAGQSFSPLSGAVRNVSFPQGTGQNPLPVSVTVSWSEKNAARNVTLFNKVTPRS